MCQSQRYQIWLFLRVSLANFLTFLGILFNAVGQIDIVVNGQKLDE